MTHTDQSNIEQVEIENEAFFKISNIDKIRPFFMSVVSDSNHWMFIGSNGGISAGRKNAENALFPYYTDDKIVESSEITGSKSIFQVKANEKTFIWEPFSIRNFNQYNISRNLYKNVYGNKVLFEEVNHDLKLRFQYQLNTSNTYGFIKKSKLVNEGSDAVSVNILDGIQNILPYGVGSMLQSQRSNLVDAYKRNELSPEGVGIYALSAIIVDKAEPSEALKANISWSMGLKNPTYLLSSLQLDAFRKGTTLTPEEDIKAEKGAYFISTEVKIEAKKLSDWMIISNVNQDTTDVIRISDAIKNDSYLNQKVLQDIEEGTKNLIQLNASADGIQLTNDKLRDTRHFSNTLFNIMRGGIFDNNYQIEKGDFINYLSNANKEVLKSTIDLLKKLPEKFTTSEFKKIINESNDLHLKRLSTEYLPLKFSRRHGDPSRPWNQFSINTQNENDGSKILDYEGNWRDIFQNWEALALSYPEFLEGMIFKFLNATTFDGYNPYRITKNGIDWERIEPDDPWSYIGYWGDHQIIYLLKFLELMEAYYPDQIESYFHSNIFVYANVPYKIKSYDDILHNPKDTIDFDHDLDKEIEKRRLSIGADAALLTNNEGSIYQVNFIEKILATVLAKMSNFIPEGGIWMNTQRPEWNDANNALVGNGVSVVTLCYLRRFLSFFESLLENRELKAVEISEELKVFFDSCLDTLHKNKALLKGSFSNKDRKSVLDGLGVAGSKYRDQIYHNSFSSKTKTLSFDELSDFIDNGLSYLEHTIEANKRFDNLYHGYNLMTVENDSEISISELSEMLEGQVAVLSSGFLSPQESLEVLDGLKSSSLFREDQYSYLLYPNKELSGFLDKNNIPESSINQSKLLLKLVEDGERSVVSIDVRSGFHFNGNLKNAADLENALNNLDMVKYGELIKSDEDLVLKLYEKIFNHKAFTGRSGTFFGYEGLGSIYWHMVSKLQLAAQECCLKAINNGENGEVIGKLLEHYYEINEGIGVHKSPKLYGAFPTDPYSHTPFTKGAQQPGMTGQVKEDILSRFGEFGVLVKNGQIAFNPCMLRKNEFIQERSTFQYYDVNSSHQTLTLPAGSVCFTYCQIPIQYTLSESEGIEILYSNGKVENLATLRLESRVSSLVFKRSGDISQIVVHIKEDNLL